MIILGTNAAGIMNKKDSFERNIDLFKPAAFFLQETKTKSKNKLKVKDYTVFEYVRKNRGGGGLMTVVHNNLNPVSIGNETDDEVIVVEAELGENKVRFVNGYGPQEDDEEEKRICFFQRLDLEVKSAQLAGTLVCIEMDANSKLGPAIIPNDPKPQSKNGKLLENVVKENGLIIVNATNLCEGVLTRYRKTIKSVEESVLDFFIVCPKFFKLIKKMKIDEERKFSLTKYSSKTGIKKVTESDHNLLILEVGLCWDTRENQKPRETIFNFKNKDNFRKYVEATEDNLALRECFGNENESVENLSKKWLKLFNSILFSNFDRIRLGKPKINPNLQLLFTKKEKLQGEIAKLKSNDQNEEAEKAQDELEIVMEKISEIVAEKNIETVKNYLGVDNDGMEGFTQPKTWLLRKKLSPKNTIDPPAAKKDKAGNLVTSKSLLEKLYLDTYTERLAPNEVEEGYEELNELKHYLFEKRIEVAQKRISRDWTIKDLDKVLKSLKNDKAKDAHGHVYELFKYGGKDLKYSLLVLFNLIKKKQVYPSILQPSNISSFYKKKGDKSDLNNDRGVFNVVKVRSILDKLIYNDIYEKVDNSMSCSNIGARKQRNIRDHLFVINGIVNDAVKTKKNEVDIEIFDVAKCFDKMSYKETANDMFNAGVTDDKFILLANSNKVSNVAVKTPWGSLTKRVEMKEIEMQGTVLAPLKCSTQIDTLGKDCLETNAGLFRYKDCVSIPPLSMIDDILAVADCSEAATEVNAIIQNKINTKQLKFGTNKCFQLHIGGNQESCSTLKVQGDVMNKVDKEKYLGDILTNDGKINENVDNRKAKGLAAANQTLSMLQEISFGHSYFEMAMLFRTSIMINSMLCSSEALYGVNKNHMEKLEDPDKYLMKRIFNAGTGSPTISFYFETGAMPIRFVLIGRRLMFLWSILQKSDNELVRRVYNMQKKFPVKDDWVLEVSKNLEECGIDFDEDTIGAMSKNAFKRLVNEKIYLLAYTYLSEEKLKKTKLANLTTWQMQDYLVSDKLSLSEKRLLYMLRVRMIEVKNNFSSKYGDKLECSLCLNHIEDQENLLKCSEIVSEVNTSEITYRDIYGTLEKQAEAIKIWKQVLKVRNSKMKSKNLTLV